MRRRASTGTANACAVDTCQGTAIRRGGYCATCHNKYNDKAKRASKLGDVSEENGGGDGDASAAARNDQPHYFVCLNACQGKVTSGFCERHNIAQRARRIAEASTPKIATPGMGLSESLRRTRTAEAAPGASPLASSPPGRRGRHARGDSVGVLPTFNKTKRPFRKRAPSIVEAMSASSDKEGQETLERFLEAIHAISGELEAHKAADQIIRQTCRLLECERSTLFYVDNDELVLMIAKGAKNIRLPKSKGIAGHVATHGETVNIADAWTDERFDSSHDKSSGFRTKEVMATPILDEDGDIVAVLQCINKKKGFTDEDVVLAKNLSMHCAVVLRNAHLYEQSQRAEHKVNSLLEIVQMLHEGSNTNSLIFTLSHRSHQLVDADRCTLYLVDGSRKQLVVMQGDVDIRIPMSKGLAGHVATTGEVVNIPDCYQDPRFNQEIDKKTGYRTRSMLCMPIFADKKEVVGVLQLINKLDESHFGAQDCNILQTMLNIAGPILKKSTFFEQHNKKKASELEVIRNPVRFARSPKMPLMRGISE